MDKEKGVEESIATASAGKPDLNGKTPSARRSSQDRVPYGKLFHWAWYVVSAVIGLFTANTALTILNRVLTQYSIMVLAGITAGLAGFSHGGVASTSGNAHSEGFLSGLLPSNLKIAAYVFAFLSVSLIILRLLDRLLMARTDNIMIGQLQQRLHDKLLALGPSYHQKHDIGETTMIVTRFSAAAQMMFRGLISDPLVRGIPLITAIVFLAGSMENLRGAPPILNASLLALLLLLPLGGWRMSNRVGAAYKEVRKTDTDLSNEFVNSASMPLEVQLMGAIEQRSRVFGETLRRHIRNKVSASFQNEIATQFEMSIPTVLQALFLIYGVFFAIQGRGDPRAVGAILAMYYFVPEVVHPIQDIIQFITGLRSMWPQVESVVEILEAEPDIVQKTGAQDLLPVDRSIVLENVAFSYAGNGARILDGVTHTFGAGKITAIVAPSGAGKSTLLNLVARVRDPQGGTLRIGNKDIKDISIASLRRHVGKVSQFPLFLFDTVRANLKLVREDAPDEELQAVCRHTRLWSELEIAAGETGNPLDYILPRASSEGLAGGQRRRLAFSRALLLDPKILLLDEPTTGVDPGNSAFLATVLRDSFKDMTVLLVDHNMEFVRHVADEVVCLENGKFAAYGSPADLSEKPCLFRNLLNAWQGVTPSTVRRLVKTEAPPMADVVGQSMAPSHWITCQKCGDYLMEKSYLGAELCEITCGRCNHRFWINQQSETDKLKLSEELPTTKIFR
jgi:ATP-binding cassette subfamily B protein